VVNDRKKKKVFLIKKKPCSKCYEKKKINERHSAKKGPDVEYSSDYDFGKNQMFLVTFNRQALNV